MLNKAKMLKKLIYLPTKLIKHRTVSIEIVKNANSPGLLKYIVTKCLLCSPFGGNGQNFRDFHSYGPRRKSEDRREMYASLPARDEGTDGEKGVDIDMAVKRCVLLNLLYLNLQVEVQNGYHSEFLGSISPTWQDGVLDEKARTFEIA